MRILHLYTQYTTIAAMHISNQVHLTPHSEFVISIDRLTEDLRGLLCIFVRIVQLTSSTTLLPTHRDDDTATHYQHNTEIEMSLHKSIHNLRHCLIGRCLRFSDIYIYPNPYPSIRADISNPAANTELSAQGDSSRQSHACAWFD